MPPTDCLRAEELRAYHLGQVAIASQERIARHLEVCPACDALAERLEGVADDVIAALRQYPPSLDTPLPPGLSGSERLSLESPTLPASETTAPDASSSLRWIGDYEILEELGRGGMGIVYKAHQRRLNRVVALKMVLSGARATSAELTRFLVEAEMVARLTHPCIVQIHEVGEHNGMPFLALEYVSGGTLAQQLRGQPWPARRAAALVEQLARAMHHAHQRGVVHRDLKPANILMDDNSSLPRITDFGLARAIQSPTGLTRTGILVGTPAYMAPEQGGGDGRLVGPASDLYALGIILYELLAGRPPFLAENPVDLLRDVQQQEVPPPSRFRRGLPRDLTTICLHCLVKEPAGRYPSAEALADDLARFLVGAPIQARPVGRLERTWKWARRRPAIALLLLTVAITLPVGTGVSTYFAVEERGRAREAELSRDEAQRARADSQEARRISDLSAAELTFHAALADADAGMVDRALFRLLEALRLAPPDALPFRRVLCINLAMLAERLPVLQRVLPGRHHGYFLGAEGETLATATTDNILEFWDTGTGKKVEGAPSSDRPLPGEPLALTRDGRVVLTKEPPGDSLRLRDAATGDALGEPLQHGAAAFTPDGRVLALAREIDRSNPYLHAAQFLRTRTGQVFGPSIQDDFRLLATQDGRLVLMTFPNRRLNSVDTTTPARFTDLETQSALDRFDLAPAAGGPTVAFDGQRLVTLDADDGTVRWWDPVKGTPVGSPWRPLRLRGGYSPFTALTADGRTQVALGTDGRLRWYHPATGQTYGVSLAVLGDEALDRLASSPDGNYLLAASPRDVLRVWRLPELPPLPAPPAVARPRLVFRSIGFSPDRRTVFVGGTLANPPVAHLVETATGQPVGPSHAYSDRLPAFSGDSQRLATAAPALWGQEARVIVREVATGNLLWSAVSPGYVHGLALDARGQHLAIGRFGLTGLIEVDTGRSLSLPQEAGVTQLLFSPDGKWLATGSQAGWGTHPSCIRVWDMASGQPWGQQVPTTDAARFCFDPGSRTLLALELRDGRLRRWRIGEEPSPNEGVYLHHQRTATHVAFRPDASQVLVGFANGTAQLYDTTTGQAVGAPLPHSAPVTALAYSPDGSTLAVGCEDSTVQLWDAATAKPLGPPLIHRYPLLGLAFASDGRSVLATTTDGTTRSWPLAEPVPDDLSRLTTWVQALTGSELKGGAVTLVDCPTWEDCRRRLRDTWPEAAAALERPADHAAWHEACAREAESQGDAPGALWHLNRLLARLPPTASKSDCQVRLRRAHLRAVVGQREAAADEYQQLREAASADAVLARFRYHADRLQATEQWDLALWYLDRALALRPDEWQLYEQRAEVHGRLGHTQQRRADLARAVERGGTGDVLVALAAEHASDARWQDARALLEKVDQPRELALVLVWMEDRAAFRQLCATSLQAATRLGDRLTPEAAALLARVCTLAPQALDDFQPAIALAEDALAATPETAFEERQEAWATLGALLLRSGQNEKALACLLKAPKLVEGKGAVRVWFFLALTYHELGRDELARDWLKKVKEARARLPGGFTWESLEVQLLCRELDRAFAGSSPPPRGKGIERD